MKRFERFSSARAGAFGGLCWALLLIGCGGYLVSSLIPAGVGPSSAQAATPVIDSSAARDAAGLVTRAIEEVQPGDRVLSREEGDAAAPVRPRRVEAVFRRTADHLRLITVRTGLGREQTLQTTDNHPFWVPGQGWVEAGKLKSGQSVTILDGASATVASTTREEHPLGIEVYNFRVEGSHTYFASAANSTGPPVWVHNANCGLTGISVRGVPLDGYAAESGVQSPLLQRYLSESGGRWGSTATRALNNELATGLESQGYKVINGAGRAGEEYIAGAGPGTTGGTFVDITATNGTQTVRIQTISTLADGVTPTPAEAAAAARIRAAFPNDELRLIPKR